jgi:hypothetical protein
MKNSTVAWVGLRAMVGLSVQCGNFPARFEGQIVDEASGTPAAARIAATDAAGREVDIEGDHPHVQYLNKRWVYVNGSFAFTIPEDGAEIEIRRGLETLPETFSISGGGLNRVIEKRACSTGLGRIRRS